jgi:hypothetical protein
MVFPLSLIPRLFMWSELASMFVVRLYSQYGNRNLPVCPVYKRSFDLMYTNNNMLQFVCNESIFMVVGPRLCCVVG